MGILVDGKWLDKGYDTAKTDGRFVRWNSVFRNWITADGSPGPSGLGGFPAEAGRYHLYVSFACPWAHRALIFRALKGLQDIISLSVVDPLMLENGWTLSAGADPVNQASFMHEVYTTAEECYSGRVTVPVLWDKQRNTIVSNESFEIIRMFNSAFDGMPGVNADLDFYPSDLRDDIDAINGTIYQAINNGVYRAGFASTQDAYEEAIGDIFDCLDGLEDRLSGQRYLVGERITEADWRLFTTLVRFDPVYVGHFKCNRRPIADYANLWAYTRELYQIPGVSQTVEMNHIKQHYYTSHRFINPTGIVPVGPDLDYTQAHGRDAL